MSRRNSNGRGQREPHDNWRSHVHSLPLTLSNRRHRILIVQRPLSVFERRYSFVDLKGGGKSDDRAANLRVSEGKANRLVRQFLLGLEHRLQPCSSPAIALI